MRRVKPYIEFITSLINMDEVKNEGFPIPKSITYSLDELEHRELHKEIIKMNKGDLGGEDFNGDFEIDIHNIVLKFSR